MGALPIGYVLITRDKYFNPNMTKNNLFVGVWENVDEYDIYPVATSEGASQISLTGADIIGSNSKSVSIDWQHTHGQNSHTHTGITDTDSHSHSMGNVWSNDFSSRILPSSGSSYGSGTKSTTSYSHSHSVTVYSATAVNQTSGTKGSTQIIDNRPYSFKTTMWIRIS